MEARLARAGRSSLDGDIAACMFESLMLTHREREKSPRKRRTSTPEYMARFDTTLTPLRAQCGAIQGNAGKRNRLIYAGFANVCKSLQRMNYHS
jgi:hypothetical protein